MRIMVKSYGKIQMHNIDFIRESNSTCNLRLNNTKGVSHYIIMPDIETRQRVLTELLTKGVAYVNSEDASETELTFDK